MNTLYVRVGPRTGLNKFYRCAMLFTVAWSMVNVDDATAARLQAEQMLEVSEYRPDDFVEPSAGDSATQTKSTGADSGTPADAPPTDPAERLAAIRAAIAQLDTSDPALFTSANKPKTDALAALTGWPVSAAERDEALEGAQ